LKHSAPDELIIAIRAALAGQTFITPALAGEVLQSIQDDPARAKDPLASLTPRQREVLQLLAEGNTQKKSRASSGSRPAPWSSTSTK
jgi:DNA-binding NarL/FixJ family response regulator